MQQSATLKGAWLGSVFSEPDERLIERVAAGERDGLEELYYRHGRALLQYLSHICSDRATAEEVLQDVLLAVWQGADRFAGRSSVLTWLFSIARRRAYTSLRRAQLPTSPEAALKNVHAPDAEPEAHVLAGADVEALSQALSDISPIHREIFALIFV